MRIMEINKSSFYYCLYIDNEPIKDKYGNESGERRLIYAPAVIMSGNISAATGTTQVEQFGNFISYDKVVVTDDMNCPIDEHTVLFIDKAPEYDEDGNPLYDYTVKRVAKSLNSISFAISKVNVS